MSLDSRPSSVETRKRVHEALAAWPAPEARRALVSLARSRDLNVLDRVGYSIARCGPGRRDAAAEFLDTYEDDRRLALRTVILVARAHLLEETPRAFVREMNRVASLPGSKPWIPLMGELYRMWAREPQTMFGLMTPWLTHRDPRRRWAALHGLEHPARTHPRSVLKVLRLLRGEKDVRVRRLLGHVLGQGLYPYHPEEGLEEMARWLSDGAVAAPAVSRRIESQVGAWFESGTGSDRQRRRIRSATQDYLHHDDAGVRGHARRLRRLLDA